ncbi:hypothetical protein, partial [Paenibacillus glycanilyticus]|uniref:hypothetical protein n=1 Tax=Paenibacillus glycanilyticus TaxID=126569 RepID=UPI00295E2E05
AGAKGYLLEERSVRLCLSFAILNYFIRGKGKTTAAEGDTPCHKPDSGDLPLPFPQKSSPI